MGRTRVESPGKLAVLALTVVGCFVLLGLDRGDTSFYIPIITMIVGYLVGNGVGALRGQEQKAVFKPVIEEETNGPEGS